MSRPPPTSTLFPYTTLFRSQLDQRRCARRGDDDRGAPEHDLRRVRSEEHTSELQSHSDLVCRLLLEKKNEAEDRPVRPDKNRQADLPGRPHDLEDVAAARAG